MGADYAMKREDTIEVEGIVKTVLWRNERDNKVIVSLESNDIPSYAMNPHYPNSCVAIGTFFRIAEGQTLLLKGRWAQDRRRRWAFYVDYYSEVIPTTREGLIGYLSSGLFKGIGVKTAERIVDHFGSDTINIIREKPERLMEIKGISTTRATAIAESYEEAKHLERLMLALSPFNISTNLIVKIGKFYGENALEKINENPYRLCDDIKGIGFKTADSIARSCNISHNDDFRIRAGIIYTLNQSASTEGHSYLPFELMVKRAQETLYRGEISGNVDEYDIMRVAIDMNNMKELIIEEDSSVYLPLFYNSEVSSSRKIKVLLKTEQKRFKHDIDKTIKELEGEQGIEYADLQKEAFRAIERTNMLVITGGPGTGKTTIIKGIIDIYKKNFRGSKIALAAPTGRAAKRMEEATGLEAKTIHRQLEYRPSEDGRIVCMKDESNPIDADLIILDECSMIDILLFSTFLKAVKPDTTLIMVGDIDQLPSVGAGSVLRDLIESQEVPVVRLDEIFRQEEASKIVVNASRINRGYTELEYDKDFIFIEEEKEKIPERIKRCFKKELVEVKDINEVQVLSPFRKNTENGSDALNKVLQEDLNKKDRSKPEVIYAQTTFRKNDKVMQHKNNYDKEIYNGDVGIIMDANPKDGDLLVRMDDKIVEFYRDELNELQLAYATTIHKSQGCEYDVVIIPVTMQHRIMLQRNLLYTGITRAKKKVILIGDRKALNYAIRNNRADKRFSKLDGRIKG